MTGDVCFKVIRLQIMAFRTVLLAKPHIQLPYQHGARLLQQSIEINKSTSSLTDLLRPLPFIKTLFLKQKLMFLILSSPLFQKGLFYSICPQVKK